MSIYEEIRQEKDRLVQIRRDLHAHPELGWKEFRTQEIICKELESLQIPYEKVCKTGVIAVIKTEYDHPVIALRADMDALPIEEKNDVKYASETPHCMHACGHDCHVAWLLTVARILKKHSAELRCTVKFIFQPAEEIIEGAREMSKLSQLDDVDHIFGAHAWIEVPVGKFSIQEGPRFASADNFTIKIKGQSAHGAQPQDAIDAIVVAGGVIQAIQSIVSRSISPLDSGVVTIGTMNGGSSSNIIADEVEMTGTVRCFNLDVQNQIEEKIREISNKVASAYGAKCEVQYIRCTPAVINQPFETAMLKNAITKVFGNDSIYSLEKTMGGEDFAWFLQKIPGSYVRVGARNENTGKCWPHHSNRFDIDEEALINGATILCELALSVGKE
ncbi:M20 metallopeptidase family protein [Kallipyga gabonensis]|uniref:M20 metallopeptidase family protein n=1 Tax=Kallipyga gabonensis TaxID=1686287 RepID=UPI0006B4EFC0|nr:amidohydrolase [Kallipyga gabonensis]